MKKLALPIITSILLCLVTTLTHAQTPKEGFGQLRTNLYIVAPDKSTVLMDGTLTQYDSSYSNEMDGKDARKMSNFSENWGMLRGNTVYVVERRHSMTDNDSIFFKMWNMRIITYQIELIAANLGFNERSAILVDNYLKTEIPVLLNDTTRIPFSVTKDAASKASGRFTLIFSFPVKTPPLQIVKTEIFAKHRAVDLSWDTEGYSENSVFEVQRSINGIDFHKEGQMTVDTGRHQFEWRDHQPVQGKTNYYRIQISSEKDSTQFGSIVSSYMDKVMEGISIYPNPVKGNHLNITLTDEPKGKYTISLNNSFGLKVISKTINYHGGKQTEQLSINKTLISGVYRLQVTGPDGYHKVISVLF